MPRITSYTPRRLDSSDAPGRPCRARWITLQGVPGLSTPFLVSIYCWFAWEVGLLVRDLVRRKGRRGLDHGTRVIVSLTLTGSICSGIVLRSWVPALDTPAPNAFAVAGAVVIWVGLALRVWAVLTLGRSFSTFIQVDAD
jgi:protein-S-isoprenylcysteine O-methyltransferase Ste14